MICYTLIKKNMSKVKLDKDEQALLEAFELGEFQSELSDERRALIAKTAENSLKKDKRINIRLSSRDLSAIQPKAIREGIPYQTLVSSILHKYASGSLQDVQNKSA